LCIHFYSVVVKEQYLPLPFLALKKPLFYEEVLLLKTKQVKPLDKEVNN